MYSIVVAHPAGMLEAGLLVVGGGLLVDGAGVLEGSARVVGGGTLVDGAGVLEGGAKVVGGGTLVDGAGVLEGGVRVVGGGTLVGGGFGCRKTTAPLASTTAKKPPAALETTSEQGLAPLPNVAE